LPVAVGPGAMELQILLRVLRSGNWLAAGICIMVALAGQARAQIMVVSPDGSMSSYSGPVIATAAGIRPLAPGPAKAQSSHDKPQINSPIRQAANRHQLSAQLVEAVAWNESRLKQNAISPKGARGVMQLMPGTARILGVDAGTLAGNIDGGAAYLAQLMRRFDGDLVKTLAAYNAGPGAVAHYGGAPPYRETKNYIDAVLDRLAASEDGTISEIRP
jgi:soluble lytic murein transglycosylase-like protein